MPTKGPYSAGARAIAIALRTAHLFAMAVFLGGLQLASPDASLRTWRTLTVATGLALLASEASHGRHWIYQGRGVATLAHVGVLALLAVDGMGRSASTAALVIGALGSHMPGSFRKWSFRHRRIVE